MSDELEATAAGDTSQDRVWQQTLETLERSLREAAQAVTLLRRQMEAAGPEADQDGAALDADRPEAQQDGAALEVEDRKAPLEEDVTEGNGASAPPQEPAATPMRPAGLSTFDRLWDRIERDRQEKEEEPAPTALSGRPGLDRLPQQYLMTVEDREGKVDLTPLHRALAGLPGADEISLVSYSNGVPVVSLRVEGELDLDQLSAAVSTAMDRECEVIPQDTGKLYLRMKARED